MDAVLRSVLPFLVILVILVLVHELGHFVTAKLAGVKVLEFGIGYPPRLWGRRFGETEYTVNLLPLGGFVRLLGEEDPSDPRSLAAKPRWVRIIVLISGAVMNAVLPVVLFTCTFLIPQEVPLGRAVIDRVNPGSPAAAAGLQTGDVILRINGHDIENVQDASYYIRLNQGRTMTWLVRRPATGIGASGSELVTVRVRGRWAPPPGQGPTGITLTTLLGQVPCSGELLDGESEEQAAQRCARARPAPTETRSYPIWEAVPKAVVRTAETLIITRNQIISWIAARTAPQVSGPVGIAHATGEVVEQAGWVALFEFSALLSINLAILNLLPLPMLDGGRVLFVVIEILRRGKRIPPEKEALVHLAGFVALICLVVVVSFVDIQRIVSGESPFR
jgi:regulator of sigma E protease